MYGWYSQKQAEVGGTFTYKDKFGEDVLVTEVSNENKYPSSWDDVRPVGKLDDSSYYKSLYDELFELLP